ncbi:MAG: DNA-processing protein DprA [Candidatus Saganbacteria bacterium]|nr:DNA-processing protein DprA [Candidatus Saganbacteria bacterium]
MLNYNIDNIALVRALLKKEGLGYVSIRKALRNFEDTTNLLFSSNKYALLKGVVDLQEVAREKAKLDNEISLLLDKYAIKENRLYIKCILDKDYPPNLMGQHDAPVALYCYGDYSLLNPNNHFISIMGSRETKLCNKAKEIASYVTGTDMILVNGYAPGIDLAAVEAFIEKKRPVIAVLGGSIFDYRRNFSDINDKVAENGLFISEFGLIDCPMTPGRLFARNKTIVSLSNEIIIIDAKDRKSGTVDAFNYAVKKNKAIFLYDNKHNEAGMYYLLSIRGDSIFAFDDFDSYINARKNIKDRQFFGTLI